MTEVKNVEFISEDTIKKDGKIFKLVEEPKEALPAAFGAFSVKEAMEGLQIVSNYVFTDEQYTRDFVDALNVILMLRRCDGVVEEISGSIQYVIEYSVDESSGDWGVRKDFYSTYYNKYSSLFPVFKDEQSVKNAIEAVGRSRILKAMKTWHQVYA